MVPKILCLPKIWFRCHCLELRAGDVVKINSSIKSWLYADLLEKPEQLVYNRPWSKGGLNVHNVHYKSLSILIKSFIETAIGNGFIKNLYHSALFRWYVLDDTTSKCPGRCPYYSPEFFAFIKQVVQEGLLNIETMSTKEWYRVLVENHFTMELSDTNERVWKPIKCELVFLHLLIGTEVGL